MGHGMDSTALSENFCMIDGLRMGDGEQIGTGEELFALADGWPKKWSKDGSLSLPSLSSCHIVPVSYCTVSCDWKGDSGGLYHMSIFQLWIHRFPVVLEYLTALGRCEHGCP